MAQLPYRPDDAQDILRYARKLLGTTLRESLGSAVVTHGVKGKGRFGNVLERHYFLYEPNSDPHPDFPEAGLELKATGLLPDGHGEWRAKERVKLNSINFGAIYHESFDRSSFLNKNRNTLLVCYEYEKGQPVVDYVVRLADIWNIPEEDLIQIEKEWNLIAQYVRDGRAHELSESLTNYIGACTTGQGKGRDLVTQPCSPVPAKRRAFSFKQPYVTRIIKEFTAREHARAAAEARPVVRSADELRAASSFEEVVLSRFKPFLGLLEEELAEELGMELSTAKNRREWLNLAILGVSGTRRVAEFEKAGITMRSFTLMTDGRRPKEDFPLPAFEFDDLTNESWWTSALRTHLLNRFLTVFYRYDEDMDLYELEDALFWGFPEDLLDSRVRETWVRTVRLVRQSRSDELPKGSETGLVFLRTHGQNHWHTSTLPNGRRVPKVSFWLHRDFLQGIYDDIDNYPVRASTV